MSKRFFAGVVLVLAALGGGGVAQAHQCDENDASDCWDTPLVENWRDGNYVPLFDINDRESTGPESERYKMQRWRDECNRWDAEGNYSGDQMCAWARGGGSLFAGDQELPAPNEAHVGYAANHCFLFEAQHQCEDHTSRGNAVDPIHDSHGGAVFADVCATPNAESKYCRQGPADTQAGVTIMDHNGCGVIVPIVACTDEYHLVRPLDPGYTYRQQANSLAYLARIANDPELYACGKAQYRGGNPLCPKAEPGNPQGRGPIHEARSQIPVEVPVVALPPAPGASAPAHVGDAALLAARGSRGGAPGIPAQATGWLVTLLAAALMLQRVYRLRMTAASTPR